MKSLTLLFAVMILLVASCADSKKSTSTALNNDKMEKDNTVSYDSLLAAINNGQEIPCTYLNRDDLQSEPKCPLSQIEILKDGQSYIILSAMHLNQSLDAYPYFLCTFSKESGTLLSFVSLGQEAEGVDPKEIRWDSEDQFSLINYSYELIEDEESGAYMQGALNDSTVVGYTINEGGIITEKTL
ncbi:MAG: hypothetical protein AAF789_12630 [Bacteroidota bacterium]